MKYIPYLAALIAAVYLLPRLVEQYRVDRMEAWVDSVYANLCRKFETK